MKKTHKIILVTFLTALAITAGVFLVTRSSRVLVFESHNPLRENLSNADLKKLFVMHEDCFAESRRENLRRYFMKYNGLDSTLAAKKADQVIESSSADQEKNFGDIVNAFVLRDKGELIGFFNCREDTEVTHGSIMVFNVCVRKDKRGQGYGEQLMRHSFETCIKPGKDFTLTVYKDHTKVVNFYKDLQFEIISNLDEWDHVFPYFNKYLMKYKPAHTSEDRQN